MQDGGLAHPRVARPADDLAAVVRFYREDRAGEVEKLHVGEEEDGDVAGGGHGLGPPGVEMKSPAQTLVVAQSTRTRESPRRPGKFCRRCPERRRP